MKKLRIVTWNLNFLANNWFIRREKVNNMLSSLGKIDVFGFQELAIAGTNKWSHCWSWGIDNGFVPLYLPFKERGWFLQKIPWILDMYYFLNCILFVFFGKLMYDLFDIKILRFLILPFFCIIFVWTLSFLFVGTGILVHNRIKILNNHSLILRNMNKCMVTDIEKNGVKITIANVHLSPDYMKGGKKRIVEIKTLLNYLEKQSKNQIVMGDMNDSPSSTVYKMMKENGFREAIVEKNNKHFLTFPAKNPEKTIDYIWIKGNQLKVHKVKTFGTEKHSDHLGLYAEINLTTTTTGTSATTTGTSAMTT